MNKLIERFMKNVKKPNEDFFGRMQLRGMNNRHSLMASWGMRHMTFMDKTMILDIGCGGGKNIKQMLQYAPSANVYGVDYSEASVNMTTRLNRQSIKNGRTKVVMGTVESLPFASNIFDLATAFETVYFWDLEKGFSEVYRILKKGGKFMIVNEAQNSDGLEDYIDTIGFRVYTASELKASLTNAGFVNISIDQHENGQWMTVLAEK